jgi:hypothetical protein
MGVQPIIVHPRAGTWFTDTIDTNESESYDTKTSRTVPFFDDGSTLFLDCCVGIKTESELAHCCLAYPIFDDAVRLLGGTEWNAVEDLDGIDRDHLAVLIDLAGQNGRSSSHITHRHRCAVSCNPILLQGTKGS